MDFVIPCHPKDIETVAMSVECLKSMSVCDEVYVISPEDMRLESTVHVDDREFDAWVDIDAIRRRWLSEHAPMAYRSNWLYQQFLKLYCPEVIKGLSDSCVVIDADSMFVRDVQFDGSRFQYCMTRKPHKPYLRTYKRLMKRQARSRFSFISHHMVFNQAHLKDLIGHVESLHGKSFFDAVLDCIDYRQLSTFSEWDLYGNWMCDTHPEICDHRQLKWCDVPEVPSTEDLKRWSADFDMVCAHAWIRGVK